MTETKYYLQGISRIGICGFSLCSQNCPEHLPSVARTEKSKIAQTATWNANQGLPRPFAVGLRWTPHPVIVTIRDDRDYIRALSYSYYTTITGWGVLLM